jgi:hypothetical protein
VADFVFAFFVPAEGGLLLWCLGALVVIFCFVIL